ncbi:Amino acid permease 5 [Spatholobus suberectus]|nr:Amino acid permease 5 [Spatholobus suberectus]
MAKERFCHGRIRNTHSFLWCGYQINFFRLVWRTIFVLLPTFIIHRLIAMLMTFFNDVVGILGATGFRPFWFGNLLKFKVSYHLNFQVDNTTKTILFRLKD